MKCSILMIPVLSLAIVALPLSAHPNASPQANAGAKDDKPADKPINAMCPIGKEPIVTSAGTVTYEGNVIGLCCPPCGKEFLAWSEADKDNFVALALAGKEPGQETHGKKPDNAKSSEDETSDLYTLDTCPVSGQKLGSMGDPVVKMIQGREVRFCCEGCVAPFEKDPEKHFKEIDKELIEQQLPYYPTDKCIVMGDDLYDDGEDIAVNYIYKNRLVRFCCKMCIKEFNASPEKFIEKLDKMIIERQAEHYPLETCIFMESSKLGSMGEPVERIYGNRLVRFCCEGCVAPFEKDPTKRLARLDEAWKAQHEQHPNVTPGAAHGHGSDHGDGEHGGHEHGDGGHDDHDHR